MTTAFKAKLTDLTTRVRRLENSIDNFEKKLKGQKECHTKMEEMLQELKEQQAFILLENI